MKKKLFAVLMAMVLVLGMSTTALAETDSPVGNNGTITNSPVWDNTQTDSPVIDNEPIEIGELEVEWSEIDSWTVEVENVATVSRPSYDYGVTVLKDGEQVEFSWWSAQKGYDVMIDISDIVAQNGSGKYTVDVWAEYHDTVKSEWIVTHKGSTEARTYTKPANQLEKPANLSFDKETGKLSFDVVDDAVGYNVYTIFSYAGVERYKSQFAYISSKSIEGNKFEDVYEYLLEEIEWMEEYYSDSDAKCEVGVCAISADIDKVAYSDYATYILYENKVSKEQAKENFDKAFENVEENPNEAVEALSGVSNETIIEMMETDATFVEKLEKLDAIFVEELADGYKGATSETKLVDADKVEVVGLAINGRDASESVELTFAEPAEKVEVEDKYENAVALDIELLVDGYAQETLEVPVAITMPIPAGVEKENLVILHYHGTATEPVVIVPTINEDGTMTFIVDGFSTFVVANQVVEATPEKPAPEAPKTGDTSGTALVCSLLFLAAGVVLVMKRNSFAK